MTEINLVCPRCHRQKVKSYEGHLTAEQLGYEVAP